MSHSLVYNNDNELLVKGLISIFSGDNMGKKKNSKSVVVTIIITLVVLGCLTFAGIKYFNAGDEGTQVKIYEFAVKIFPLLVGVVLIVIASMIATSREETDDEEDKLPPNSYDQQLFEAPADDPAAKTASKVVQPEETAQDEVAPEEAEEFYSIFDAPEDIVRKEEEEAESEEEPVAEPQAAKVAPQAAVVAAAAPSALEKPLIEAIYTLVNKLNDVTDYLSYEEEDEEEDDLDDYEYYDTPQEEEEAEAEEYEEEPQSYENTPLENKIDKLCDAIANLTAIVSAQALAAPAAAPAPAPVAQPVEKKPEPAPAPVIERVEVPVEVPVDQEINDIDVTDPIQRARIEFDSAKDGEYDISFVYTDADVDNVLASLGGTGDAFEINGKTVAIIPFLTGAEAKDELDKIGIAYDIQTIDADAIVNGDFDRDIMPRL